jgi:hypothetical protein
LRQLAGSGSEGRDLAAWISPPLGSIRSLLLLRWSEGRGKQETYASFNKDTAVFFLLQRGSGWWRLLLAGLGGEGERVRLLGNNDVDELPTGRGGEKEHSHVVTILSAYWRVYLCCF